jgi:ubiquinone/menaquinone biosynthesis C-methylase UbiE
MSNIDVKTVTDFGREWATFDQSTLAEEELREHFNQYFGVFPWERLTRTSVGFDMGCGSGRWAKLVAPNVGKLHCIDASAEALAVSRKNCAGLTNCKFHQASFGNLPLGDGSMDFGYCLGVLHHLPDPFAGLQECVAKLKPGAPLLVYVYYAFDNRPAWFRAIWKGSDLVRRVICRLPHVVKRPITDLLAVLVYFPMARTSLLLEKMGFDVEVIPLSAFRRASFYSMRTDTLDRFGTRVEHRFTARQIQDMMERAGLENVTFEKSVAYWTVVGYKKV